MPCSRGPELSDSEGRCSIDLTVTQNPEAAAAPSCGPPPGAESDGCCFRGSENPDRKTGTKRFFGLAACAGFSVADVESIAFSAALPLCQCLWLLRPLY